MEEVAVHLRWLLDWAKTIEKESDKKFLKEYCSHLLSNAKVEHKKRTDCKLCDGTGHNTPMTREKGKLKNYIRGHLVYYDIANDIYRYDDDDTPAWDKDRNCTNCDKTSIDGHDACIANIPGATNACCGHGNHKGYISFKGNPNIHLDRITGTTEEIQAEANRLKGKGHMSILTQFINLHKQHEEV